MSMRSRIALSVVPALAIGAAACSKKTPPPEPTKAPPAETKPAEDAAAPAPDAAAPAPDAAAPAPDAAPADAAPANADAAPANADAAPANADAAPANTDAAPANTDAAAATGDAAAATGDAAAPAPAAVWAAEGFSAPESVLVVGDGYLVSNLNGNPLDKDDNGFISKLGTDGKIVELKWIDGAKADVELNAPKGMVVLDGVLYVSDIDSVRKFDAATGAPKGAIAIANATFLNDLALAGKTVYVSDSAIGPDFKPKGTPAIFAIVGDAAPVALEIPNLGLVNGVFAVAGADGDVVYSVDFGANKAVLAFDTKTKATTSVAVPAGQLDGLEVVKDGEQTWFVVSSWETGAVYKIDKDGKATTLASGLKGPADLTVDAGKKLVLVPAMMDGKVSAFAL